MCVNQLDIKVMHRQLTRILVVRSGGGSNFEASEFFLFFRAYIVSIYFFSRVFEAPVAIFSSAH